MMKSRRGAAGRSNRGWPDPHLVSVGGLFFNSDRRHRHHHHRKHGLRHKLRQTNLPWILAALVVGGGLVALMVAFPAEVNRLIHLFR